MNISTVLALAGSVLVIAGAAVFVAAWTLPGALALAGVLILLLACGIDRRAAAS